MLIFLTLRVAKNIDSRKSHNFDPIPPCRVFLQPPSIAVRATVDAGKPNFATLICTNSFSFLVP